jgi:hypothetical protein
MRLPPDDEEQTPILAFIIFVLLMIFVAVESRYAEQELDRIKSAITRANT